jgi:hypothetical protein
MQHNAAQSINSDNCVLVVTWQRPRVMRVALRGTVDRRRWLLFPSTSSFVNSGNCFSLSVYISERSEGQVVAPQLSSRAGERPEQVWSPVGSGVVSTESMKPGFMLTAHFRLVTRARMSGAITLLPLYAFVACPGTNLPCGHVPCADGLSPAAPFWTNWTCPTARLHPALSYCREGKMAPLVLIVSQMKPLFTSNAFAVRYSLMLAALRKHTDVPQNTPICPP